MNDISTTDATLVASIITACASLVVAFFSYFITVKIAKSKEKFDLNIVELNNEYQKQIEMIRTNLLRIEKNFSHKENSLILVYETIAEIFYYLECYLVPLTTNDIDIPKDKILNEVSNKFRKLRLITLQKELYIPNSAKIGITMANLMSCINRIQNQPNNWSKNVRILQEEFKKELEKFQDRIKEELKLIEN